jgi:hypothetical protein
MNLYDKYLEATGLKYEDLSPAERETFNQAVFSIKNLSIADLREYISDMKNTIALQLSEVTGSEDADIEKDLVLKARLKNYILLEAFLTAPEKAEKALNKQLENIKPQKGV